MSGGRTDGAGPHVTARLLILAAAADVCKPPDAPRLELAALF
jgi:hypothetical protein